MRNNLLTIAFFAIADSVLASPMTALADVGFSCEDNGPLEWDCLEVGGQAGDNDQHSWFMKGGWGSIAENAIIEWIAKYTCSMPDSGGTFQVNVRVLNPLGNSFAINSRFCPTEQN